jgi:hypothetical protein
MFGIAAGGPQVMTRAPAAIGAGGGGFDWRTLLSALSSLAPTLAAARSSRRAQNELDAGDMQMRQAQAQADQRIGDEVMALSQSTPDQERRAAAVDYTRAVRQARNEGNASVPAGLGSATQRADVAARAGEGARYGNKMADTFARIDAPLRQRERETRGVANARGDVAREGSRASSADFIARLRAQNRARVSPWASMLGQLGQQIARNYQRPSDR